MRVGLLNRIVLLERTVNKLIGALANLFEIQVTGEQTFTTISLIMLRKMCYVSILKKSVVCRLQFTTVDILPAVLVLQWPASYRINSDSNLRNRPNWNPLDQSYRHYRP